MRLTVRIIISVLVVTFTLTFTASDTAVGAAAPKEFHVFNAIRYAGTPDLSAYGIKPVNVIYEAGLNDPPAAFSKVRRYSSIKVSHAAKSAMQHQNTLVVLDMETWGWNADAMRKYLEVIREFRGVNPYSKISMFGVMPTHGYLLYNAFSRNKPSLVNSWEKLQRIATPIMSEVDALTPSVYTMGPNTKAWAQEAKLMVQRARQEAPGKPVYVFVWPQYYAGSSGCKPGSINAQFLPAAVWRNELETLYPIADGVVLWSPPWACSGDGRAVEHPRFSADMPWFTETIRFMKSHSIK